MTFSEKSVLSTVIYCDTLNLPVTSWEIFEYLISSIKIIPKEELKNIDIGGIVSALDGEMLRKFIGEKNGFYFLQGREELYERRIERQKIADKKWKKALEIVRLFAIVPFVSAVCANGSLAMNNTGEESDLDVLVFVKPGRIWMVRFLLAALTALFGVKRFKDNKNICDKICFNHFMTDDCPVLEFRSVYTAFNYARLELIYGNADVLRNFYGINEWINGYLPNFNGQKKNNQRFLPKSRLKVFGKILEFIFGGFFGNFSEGILRKYQLERIRKNKRDIGWGRIMINNAQLEFHPHSAEKEIMEKYDRKIKEFGL